MAETKKTTSVAKATKTVKTTATKKVEEPKVEVVAETVKQYDGPMIKITQIKSSSGRIEKQQKTLKALGLRKIGQSVIKRDNEQTRGMIYVVNHLVKVENV